MILQPADLLLFRVKPRSGLSSKVVGWGERLLGDQNGKGEYSHVALVDEDRTGLYEAYFPVIRWRPLHFWELKKDEAIEVYRFALLAPEQGAAIITYAKRHVGDRYNMLAILSFGILGHRHEAVCSQYAWRAYHAAGISLCPYERLVSPDDLAGSHQLTRVLT